MSALNKIALAVVDLTPGSPQPMGGQQGPDRLARHAHGRLEANIAVFGEGAAAVIVVSIDTLFAGAVLTEGIVQACARRFGVGPGSVLVLASHTHSAPMLDPAKPGIGRADPDEVARCAALIADAVTGAQAHAVASVRVGLGESDLAVNRRLRWRIPTLVRALGKIDSDVYVCDNQNGPRDRRIRTAVWLSPDGRPLAALWSFACHPTAFPVEETSSPDYIGVVREALRQRLGTRVPVIFAPGCMGDVRPPSAKPWKTVRRIPNLIIYGPQPVPYDLSGWEAWAQGLAGQVMAADLAGEMRQLDRPAEAMAMVRLPMSEIFEGEVPTPEFHVKTVRLPGFGRVVALSCEPVSTIPQILGADDADLVLGYEGDVFGYLPTEAMIAEGGYEARRFMTHFGLEGAFKPGLDARMAALGEGLLSRSALNV